MPKALSRELTRDFIQATLKNAHDLLADAVVLFEHERWARAHALAVGAMEEIGKANLAHEDITLMANRKWRRGRPTHLDKLLSARQFYAFVTMIRDTRSINVDQWFADEHDFEAVYDWEVRQSGLYVDVVEGQVVGGHTSVTEDAAARTVAFANELVHTCLNPLWRRSEGLVEDASPAFDAPF